MTERTAREATIRAYAASWAARDRKGWLRTFATDATQEDPVGVPIRRGHREIGEFWDREMARYRSMPIYVGGQTPRIRGDRARALYVRPHTR